MAYKIADISNYQVPENGNVKGWIKALKNKYNVASVCILVSGGTDFVQPYAGVQAYHAYKEFGNFSAYHFFKGVGGKAEAQFFLQQLKNIGADKSTVVMLDAEVKVKNMTSHINAFIDTVYDAGYHNIFVYSMESMFNSSNNCIQVKNLHHKPKIWVANISYAPSMKHDAWQYTWTGSVLGKDVDLDWDDTGILAHGAKKETIADKYWTSGRVFEALSDVRVYEDISLDKNKKTYNYYSKGSHFDVESIEYAGKYPRLKNKYGYISANKDFVKKYK